MPRFFLQQEIIPSEPVCLTGDDAHHIARSLRMAVGDALTLCDAAGNEYEGEILSFEDDRAVWAKILCRRETQNEPPYRIRLFQALPKGDKLDFVIQKAVECGASEIIPFESEYCVARMKSDSEDRKTQRRQKIAQEAAKQCGRGVLPQVGRTVSFSDMLRMASESEICLFCYEASDSEPLGRVLRRQCAAFPEKSRISVIVGSEGGFSRAEAQAAEKAGMNLVGLGRRILRTETASLFVLSCICYETELDGASV